MMGNRDCFALMLGDESPADGMSSATCLEEAVIVLRRWPRAAVVAGVASQWRNSAKSNYTKANGIRSHAHAGKPV
jgi:hypothetical protein